MKFSVPTRFSADSIAAYADLNRQYRATREEVYEVYGTLSSNPLGSTRVSNKLPTNDFASLAEHVLQCHTIDLRFNLTLNSPCLGNIEYTPEGQKEIIDFVRRLLDAGIDAVTVSNIFLMDLIRNHTQADVFASIITNIDSAENARFLAQKGVRKIVLSSDIYRNLAKLRQIREAVPCQLELIANMFCLTNCPLRHYHYTTTGHASQNVQVKPQEDYCSLNCALRILEEPYKILQIPVLRPEDVRKYQDIGIDSMKIAGRTASQQNLISLTQLYMLRSFPGDLGLLIDRRTVWKRVQHRLPSGTPLFEIRVHNNEALDDLLQHIFRKRCLEDCRICGLCEKMAKNILEYDESLRQLYLPELRQMLKEQTELGS